MATEMMDWQQSSRSQVASTTPSASSELELQITNKTQQNRKREVKVLVSSGAVVHYGDFPGSFDGDYSDIFTLQALFLHLERCSQLSCHDTL